MKFKFLTKKGEEAKQQVVNFFDTRTTNEVIDEIHDTFYTEVDKLLVDAKVFKSLDTDKQDLIDKCNRLKALGFVETKEIKEAEIEINRLSGLQLENRRKESLIEAIVYFSLKYPQYKFITEDSVKKICAKYNLIYGDIKLYIGTVPDKNLKHIEEFVIKSEDECYVELYSDYYESRNIVNGYYNLVTFNKQKEKRRSSHFGSYIFNKCSLEIAASQKDFNLDKMEIKDFKISKVEIPDPIVMKPVYFKGSKCYLIVTAWGQEANDVVNEKLN